MTVNVRFVPRSQIGSGFEAFEGAPVGAAADLIAPSKPNMMSGRKALTERGVPNEASDLNRLVAEMSDERFVELFGEKQLNRSAVEHRPDDIVLAEDYVRPRDVLKLPDALSDAFAFAYVPTPVSFYSANAVPPFETNYHLRVADVALGLNAPRCNQAGWTGKGVKVAMADTGFWLHPFFIRAGYQLLPTQSPGSGPADRDDSGHGTGEAANIFALAPQATVYGVKHGSSAAGTLEACIALKPEVMTNSWGWSIDTQTREQLQARDPNMFAELLDVESVLVTARDANICVIFSAGNGHFAFPASLPSVIAAGGVTLNEDGSFEASSYASGFKSKLYAGRTVPDVCGFVGRSDAAPMTGHIMLPVPPGGRLDGENFASGRKGSGWGIFSGTSAAAPQIAGAVALLKQIQKNLTPEQIRQVLQARAIDVDKGTTATGEKARSGVDVATGSGLVDALRACGYLTPI